MNLKLAAALGEMNDLEACTVVSAPGRVNLIGEHTDYNGGLVLPMAIGARAYAAYEASGSPGQLKIMAVDCDKEVLTVGHDDALEPLAGGGWRNYAMGVLSGLVKRGLQLPVGRIAISGDIPQGAGLSSSAAFEVALAKLLCEVTGFDLSSRELALVGQEAEHSHAGCACGLMDQWISSAARKDHALLIDFSTETTRYIPFPDTLSVLVMDSGVRRELANSEYNLRRASCEAVAKRFEVPSLSDLSLETLEAQKGSLNDENFRRARHVITENERTGTAARCLMDGDLASLFTAVSGSHASLRDDYEVTIPETDYLVEKLQKEMGPHGAARMTGGGFGGCVIAIGRPDLLANAGDKVMREYNAAFGGSAKCYLYRAHEGARVEGVRG